MRSAVLDLTWYQYFLLDVIARLALAAVCVLSVVRLISRAVVKRIFYIKARITVYGPKKYNWITLDSADMFKEYVVLDSV
jgi:hypothetical protein